MVLEMTLCLLGGGQIPHGDVWPSKGVKRSLKWGEVRENHILAKSHIAKVEGIATPYGGLKL